MKAQATAILAFERTKSRRKPAKPRSFPSALSLRHNGARTAGPIGRTPTLRRAACSTATIRSFRSRLTYPLLALYYADGRQDCRHPGNAGSSISEIILLTRSLSNPFCSRDAGSQGRFVPFDRTLRPSAKVERPLAYANIAFTGGISSRSNPIREIEEYQIGISDCHSS
jgi:hypothetical protein